MRKKVVLFLLEVIFFGTIVFASSMSKYFDYEEISPVVFWLAFALSVFRMSRTISFNEVMEWLREPFTIVEKDSCGAGENVHPRKDKGKEVEVIGILISCPICTGTWCALFLFVVWSLFPPKISNALILTLGLAGASEILNYFAMLLEWSGRLARVLSGAISPDKE